MRATHLRIGGTYVSLLVTALLAATAQQVPVDAKQNNVGQLTAERDKEVEDKIAKMFEDIRINAKIPHLKRIGHRAMLERQVCTIALTGKFPTYHATTEFGFYEAARPEITTPELNKVALLAAAPSRFEGATYHPSYSRYSVAVSKVKGAQAGKPTYWVGVQLFFSAELEFFDHHLTDDSYYRNEWKKAIAPPCRGK
jgi:hypothetical protein